MSDGAWFLIGLVGVVVCGVGAAVIDGWFLIGVAGVAFNAFTMGRHGERMWGDR